MKKVTSEFDLEKVEELLTLAFHEDIGTGDVTTDAIVDINSRAEAEWVAKDEGIIAGLGLGRTIFKKLDDEVIWSPEYSDGDRVAAGAVIVHIRAKTRALLTAERIALNFVQRMSGIATLTGHFVDRIKPYSCKILDTRKTVPGLRYLDKYAVKTGEGTNHRIGLFDLAMIKDNHIIAAGGIDKAVQRVRTANPDIRIEVETNSLDQVHKALEAKADIIMLDNMALDQMKAAVDLVDGRAKTEASGNVTLDTVEQIAATGVDFISIGALTHSVKAFDISQKILHINN